jgi:pyruvate dehydrogenase E2 component (dihydrolipoamide acetyltransferase)
MAEFVMPILGADMTEGTLLEWRKTPGDRIERGEIIAEVETDKANIEVESMYTGVLERIIVQEGTKVPVGTPLAIIAVEGEAPAAAAPVAAPEKPARAAVEPGIHTREVRAPDGERVRVSAFARQLAKELGVDLATLAGTGPGGRIIRRDIEAAAGRVPTAARPEAPGDRQLAMRRAIATAMSRSSREIPHFHVSTDIDMHTALAWLTAENERRPVKDRILYVALLVKATALALREVPELNGAWSEEEVRSIPSRDINIGLAISLRGGGLVAPALAHCDTLPLDDLMRRFADLVKRARAGSLRSSEVTSGTITITNLGETGAEAVYGIIYPPQVALVGFGRISQRPWAVEDMVGVRPVITATLTADHRVVDGHRASVFLATLDRLLQEPEKL